MLLRLLNMIAGSRVFLDEVYDDFIEEVKDTVVSADHVTPMPLDNYRIEDSYLAILIVLLLAAVVITAVVLIIRVLVHNRRKEDFPPEIIEADAAPEENSGKDE